METISASLAIIDGNHRWPVVPLIKGQECDFTVAWQESFNIAIELGPLLQKWFNLNHSMDI